MNLDKDGLAAAEEAFYGRHEQGFIMRPLISDEDGRYDLERAITAYLSALPNTGDELVAELRTYQHWEGQTNLGTDCYGHPEICDRAADAIVSLVAERDNWRRVAERCKSEAESHAMEARTANSTIYEIYQVLSGGKGEPGNWNGAEPARQYVAAAEAQLKAARELAIDDTAAAQWLRQWVKRKFGPWITWRTAWSAIKEMRAQPLSLTKEGEKP